MDENNGMVSGVCLGTTKDSDLTIILIENLDPQKPLGHLGLPGGIIELGENPKQALIREWEEEVGRVGIINMILDVPDIIISKDDYFHNVYFLTDNGCELRKTGTTETGPPIRVLLKDIVSKNLTVFFSHAKIIYSALAEFMDKEAENVDTQILFAWFGHNFGFTD